MGHQGRGAPAMEVLGQGEEGARWPWSRGVAGGKTSACSSQDRGRERPRKIRKEGARGEVPCYRAPWTERELDSLRAGCCAVKKKRQGGCGGWNFLRGGSAKQLRARERDPYL
jgi:hypothetical protein